jgi:lipoprotein signal peptidase
VNALFFLYTDLVCSVVIMISACWLLTDLSLRRINRTCHACIAAGALANIFGIVADRIGFQDISYGNVWPGEVVVNIGLAVMLGATFWRSVGRRLQWAPLQREGVARKE